MAAAASVVPVVEHGTQDVATGTGRQGVEEAARHGVAAVGEAGGRERRPRRLGRRRLVDHRAAQVGERLEQRRQQGAVAAADVDDVAERTPVVGGDDRGAHAATSTPICSS